MSAHSCLNICRCMHAYTQWLHTCSHTCPHARPPTCSRAAHLPTCTPDYAHAYPHGHGQRPRRLLLRPVDQPRLRLRPRRLGYLDRCQQLPLQLRILHPNLSSSPAPSRPLLLNDTSIISVLPVHLGPPPIDHVSACPLSGSPSNNASESATLYSARVYWDPKTGPNVCVTGE